MPPLGRDDDIFDVGTQQAIGHRPGEANKLVAAPCAHGGSGNQDSGDLPGRALGPPALGPGYSARIEPA